MPYPLVRDGDGAVMGQVVEIELAMSKVMEYVNGDDAMATDEMEVESENDADVANANHQYLDVRSVVMAKDYSEQYLPTSNSLPTILSSRQIVFRLDPSIYECQPCRVFHDLLFRSLHVYC
jgi:uncharacterized heparinase superfamily protein